MRIPDTHGKRVYLRNVTASQARKAFGKLAKKVRIVTGGVEVIHTHNGSGPTKRASRGIYLFGTALNKLSCTK